MKIAILGAGVAGLTAATLLSRAGRDITLYDQFIAPAPVGSGLVVQPVGLKVLREIGAADLALTYGAPGYRMEGFEVGRGRKILNVSYGPDGGANFGLGIHRASLFDTLLKTAQSHGVQIISSHCVTGTSFENGKRHVMFEAQPPSAPYDLVIDTLGAGSPLSPLRAKPLEYGAIWGTVDWPTSSVQKYDQLSQRYNRARNMIGILPIGTLPNDPIRKATIFWSLPVADYQTWRDAPLESWKADAVQLWPEMEPFLAQIDRHDDMTMARYSHGTLRKPYGDGIVHIGDAAHRASPQLGQGANMALLDAYALATCLDRFDLQPALAAYTKSRRLHVESYQMMSKLFTPMYQSNSQVLPFLRDWLLAPASFLPPMPSILRTLVRGSLVNPHRGLD